MAAIFQQALSKYLPAWVGLDLALALAVGWAWPGVVWLERLVPLFLLVMLYPMMINLRVEAIGRALKSPRLLLAAVAMNFVLTPLMGFAWAEMFFRETDSYLISGFILKTLVPGSGMVAAWTGYARGRVESALIIVAVSLLLSVVLTPLWMWFLAGVYVTINPLVILRSMLLIVLLPLAAGCRWSLSSSPARPGWSWPTINRSFWCWRPSPVSTRSCSERWSSFPVWPRSITATAWPWATASPPRPTPSPSAWPPPPLPEPWPCCRRRWRRSSRSRSCFSS
ncbi:MAG: arsenic resistance protein [Deltaproteobacteria bacterium]|nr:arsenic resistance protein [Deltaproteobacteria bacterium]